MAFWFPAARPSLMEMPLPPERAARVAMVGLAATAGLAVREVRGLFEATVALQGLPEMVGEEETAAWGGMAAGVREGVPSAL